jgi:hemerythrin-like domain-containing protein
MQGSPGAAAWHDEHVYFGRLLEVLGREADRFAAGLRANLSLVLGIIEYLREYSDRYHHPREDAAFAILEQRMPHLRGQFAHLRQQHQVIAAAGEGLARCVGRTIEGAIDLRGELVAAARLYILYYRHHIVTEEREAVWRAARTLGAGDWQAIIDSVPVVSDPLFGATPRERYRQIVRPLDRTPT